MVSSQATVMILWMVILVFVPVHSLGVTLGDWGRSDIQLINNGYSGILAAIHPQVPVNDSLIQSFRDSFTAASSFLFNATKRRAFFRDITILIPDTWPDNQAYRYAPRQARLDAANVVIRSSVDNPDIPPAPFVRQPGQCGHLGEYMHLTPEFLLEGQAGRWGDPARAIVHEWGHLRWGLFDEYAVAPNDPQFYITSDGELTGTKCSAYITGEAIPLLAQHPSNENETAPTLTRPDVVCTTDGMGEGEVPPPQCRFKPSNIIHQTATGSLMFSHTIPSINSFCHSDPNGDIASLHTSEAPTQQNKLCQGQSSWDVMLQSADFMRDNNPPRADNVDTAPTFKLIHQKPPKTVVVIDTTSAMSDDGPFQEALSICRRIINDAPTDSWVGIASYDSKPRRRAPLTQINPQSKQTLLSRLPSAGSLSSGSDASPAEALRFAYQVILGGGGNPRGAEGAQIYVFSAWQGSPQAVRNQVQAIRNAEVSVEAVAFSPPGTNESINIANILEPFFLYPITPTIDYILPSESSLAPELTPVYVEPVDPEFLDLENNPRLVQVVRRSIDLPPFMNITQLVHIDGTIGRQTTFRFSWESNAVPGIRVHSPSGVVYGVGSTGVAVVDPSQHMGDFRLPGLAQKGTWRYSVKNLHITDTSVDIQVFSGASRPGRDPIRARPILMKSEVNVSANPKLILYGEVKQGEMPIVDANVIATVDCPNGDPVRVTLRDSGTGADTRANDGIYSAHFTRFTEAGNYQFDLVVTGDGTAAKHGYPSLTSGVMPVEWNIEQPIENVHVDPFMRSPPEYDIEVTGDVATLMARDNFPPARIGDLEVLGFTPTTRRAVLRWTAMGDDYELGQAARYEIRYSSNAKILGRAFMAGVALTSESVVRGNLTSPKPSHQTEIMTIALPPGYCNPLCAIRVRAVDDVGNSGAPSNMVTVVIPQIFTTAQTYTSFTDVTKIVTEIITTQFAPRPRGFSPRLSPTMPKSTSETISNEMLTKSKGDTPNDSRPKKTFTATVIAVAVVTILVVITVIVLYTVLKHTNCTAGWLKRYRHRNWGRQDTNSQMSLEMPQKKRIQVSRRVSDALVLEDF